jgi:predicted metal-dependent hydrolase
LPLFYRFTALSIYRFREPHHSPAFWQRIERALPEYEASKQWLAEQGAWYAL